MTSAQKQFNRIITKRVGAVFNRTIYDLYAYLLNKPGLVNPEVRLLTKVELLRPEIGSRSHALRGNACGRSASLGAERRTTAPTQSMGARPRFIEKIPVFHRTIYDPCAVENRTYAFRYHAVKLLLR